MKNFSGTLAFVICFMIGCLFLYWAVEYWVYNSFDGNRYELSKIQVSNSDSLSTWVLDKRTGGLEYCTKSYDKMDHFVCIKSVVIEAKDYSDQAEPLKTLQTPGTATDASGTAAASGTAMDASGTAQASGTATATGTAQATAPSQKASEPAKKH